MEVKVSVTNRGEKCFLIDGYIFKSDKIVKKSDHTKFYCHCELMNCGCLARSVVKYHESEYSAKVTKVHNGHAKRLERWQDIEFRQNLKAKVIDTPELSHRQIYDEVIDLVLRDMNDMEKNEAASSVSDFLRVRSTMQRKRATVRPPLPQTQVHIDGSWSKTDDGRNFLLFETGGENNIQGGSELCIEK